MHSTIPVTNNTATTCLKETVINEKHITHIPVTTVSDHHLISNGTGSTTNAFTHNSHHTGAIKNDVLNGNYPTVTFRPLEAKFMQDKDLIGKMDPYCKFKIGIHSGKSSVAKSEGTHPIWAGDAIVLKRKNNEEFAKIKIKDKDRLSLNDNLGEIKIRLDEIAAKGRMTQWFALEKRGKMTGEVLLDIEYHVPATRQVITETHTTNVPLTATADHHLIANGTTAAAYPATHINHHHTDATHKGALKGNYPTVTFRPLEGKFMQDKDLVGKMDPYCKFKIGWHSGKSSVAKSEGTHPIWAGDSITIKRKHNEEFAKIKVKDHDKLTFNDRLGEIKIRLDEVAAKGRMTQWFVLEKRGKMSGEILLEIEYHNAPRTIITENNAINVPLAPTSHHLVNNGIANGHNVAPLSNHHHHVATTNGVMGDFHSVLFRPLEAKFFHDKDPITKMDPYCKVKIGWNSGKSTVAKNEGANPVWIGETIVLLRKHNEEFAKLKVKDQDKITFNDRIGEVKIRLDDIAIKGKVTQWFALEKAGKVTGEILLDIEYHTKPFINA